MRNNSRTNQYIHKAQHIRKHHAGSIPLQNCTTLWMTVNGVQGPCYKICPGSGCVHTCPGGGGGGGGEGLASLTMQGCVAK